MRVVTTTDMAYEAYRQLLNLVQVRWFDAAPRVIAWEDTLVAAFEAHYMGWGAAHEVDLPDGTTGPDGRTTDTAANIIDAFDRWLGHGTPVTDILEWVDEENEEVKA